jgi:MFS family permease
VTKYLIFGIIGLSFMLVAISGTTIAVAFPDITSEFNVSLILAGWVLSINQLMATAIMPLGGKAGEIFGAKRVYLVSMGAFIIGSLICALAPHIGVLIFGRLLQASGLGAILPVATTIISDTFPEARQQAIGFFASILPIGNIIGPNIGGWMVESFGWRSTFWLNIPLGLIVFIASARLFKSGQREGGKLDLLGTGYFSGGLSAFLICLSTLGDVKSVASGLLPAALFMAAMVLLVAFYRREGRITNPLVDLDFLRLKPFLAANLFNLFYGAAALGVMSFVPLFATSVYGMSTLESGIILTPRAVGMVLATLVTSYYLPRLGYRGPLLTGVGIIAASTVLLGLEPKALDILGMHFSAVFLVGTLLFFAGAGMGILAPAANNACIDLAPDRIAMITGLRGTFRQGGSAVSIAATALVLHFFTDIGHGFTMVYWGLAVLLLLVSPTIFMMPKSPKDLMPGLRTGKAAA